MKKILLNIAGVGLACATAHQVMGVPVSWSTWGMGIGMCVIANLIGLHQDPPAAA